METALFDPKLNFCMNFLRAFCCDVLCAMVWHEASSIVCACSRNVRNQNHRIRATQSEDVKCRRHVADNICSKIVRMVNFDCARKPETNRYINSPIFKLCLSLSPRFLLRLINSKALLRSSPCCCHCRIESMSSRTNAEPFKLKFSPSLALICSFFSFALFRSKLLE